MNLRDLKRGSRRFTTEHADKRLGDACARKVVALTVHKVTWTQVGMVTEPGRYMFRFGWLIITADDLAIWKQFPNAAFTLCNAGTTTQPGGETEEEFRLGTFELPTNSSYLGESEK